MPEDTNYRFGANCCKCLPQVSGLDIIVLMENLKNLTYNNSSQTDPWGSQWENGIFGWYIDRFGRAKQYNNVDGYSKESTINKISQPYVNVGLSISTTYLAWYDLNITLASSYPNWVSKAEIGSNVILDTLRSVKKSHLQIKDTLKFYFYVGKPPNGNWVPGLLSPTDHLKNKNTLSMLFWPTFKSIENDPNPIGIKTTGEFASDANQDYSFSAILSEGRTNNFYKSYSEYSWKTYPTGKNTNFYRPLDNNLAFVKGLSISPTDENNTSFWSPTDSVPAFRNVYMNTPQITMGNYFTFNLYSGTDPGNDDPKSNQLIDSCKIYRSQYSGYMVDVKDYFSNGNSWPTGYGIIEGPYDLFSARNNLNISDSIFPQLPYDGAVIQNGQLLRMMWDGEYLFRIPESEKNKISWRNVRISVADFADYHNSWRINQNTPANLCIPYKRSKAGNYDQNILLCAPDCLTDSLKCSDFNYLSSAEAKVTSLNSSGQIKSIFWDGTRRGLYFNYPAVQVNAISGLGVGATLSTFNNTILPIKIFPSPNDRLNAPNLTMMSSAPKILSYGFGYNTNPQIQFQYAQGINIILEENFDSAIYGKNNDITYTGWVEWPGSKKFPAVKNVFQADGAILLSGKSAYLQTSGDVFLDIPAGRVAFSVDGKGWDPIEGNLKISISGVSEFDPVIYNFPTNKINESFQTLYGEFDSTTGKNIRFEVTSVSGRIFLDNIKIFTPGSIAAGYERGWVIRSNFSNNFDNAYSALLYMPNLDSWTSNSKLYGNTANVPGNFLNSVNQGFSALKNACLKFDDSANKMIIFICDTFPSYSGTINNYTTIKCPFSDLYPYPSKEEVKQLLDEKKIILHSIAFSSSYYPYTTRNATDEYNGLSSSLWAYAPITGNAKADNNTRVGYLSPLEEVTLTRTGQNASESKLWILNRYSIPSAAFPTGDTLGPGFSAPSNWPRDRTHTKIDGTLSRVQGGRIIKTPPASPLKTQFGIFYSIRKALGEEGEE